MTTGMLTCIKTNVNITEIASAELTTRYGRHVPTGDAFEGAKN